LLDRERREVAGRKDVGGPADASVQIGRNETVAVGRNAMDPRPPEARWSDNAVGCYVDLGHAAKRAVHDFVGIRAHVHEYLSLSEQGRDVIAGGSSEERERRGLRRDDRQVRLGSLALEFRRRQERQLVDRKGPHDSRGNSEDQVLRAAGLDVVDERSEAAAIGRPRNVRAPGNAASGRAPQARTTAL
jgi:hypothetical protein